MAAAPAAPRIFVSYARSDGAELAREIQRRLEQEHELPVWRDLAHLEGTDAWWPQVRDAIDKVEHLVLIMTQTALRSEYVRREWRYARRVGKCVIPIQAEQGQSFEGLPRWMARHNFVAWWENDSWRRLVRTLEGPCRATRVPFMAGDLPEDYVERPDEFEQLRAQVLDSDRGKPIGVTTALKGAGGFGKTTLAKALCHDEAVRDALADGILWLTLGQTASEADRVEHIRDLIEALTDKRPGFANLDAAAAELAGVLADREALIVIDDAWRRADLEPFLQGGPDCARLITTRMTDVLPRETKPVDVDAMRPDQASALLRYDLPEGEDAALAALTARLGEWPLLLKLANGVLHFRVVEAGESLADAIVFANEALDESGLTAFDPEDAPPRDRAAAASIAASLSLLGDSERARFEELGVFAEDAQVPLDLVAAIWKGTGGLTRVQAERLWARLFQASLILRLDLKAKRLQLHDVIRGYLQAEQKARLPALHGELIEAYRARFPDGWHTGPDDGYFFQHLPYHLAEAGQADERRVLLFDYRWLRRKLELVGPAGLIQDFEQLGTDEQAQKMAAGLRLSAHALARHERQLPGQLLGRFRADDGPAIATLLDNARQRADSPALLPLRPTLTPPGTGLIRILAGHSGAVAAVAALADGKRALSGSSDQTLRLWDVDSGAELRCFVGHTSDVTAVAVLPDGKRALSASYDGTLRLWDLASGAELRRFEGGTAVAVLPDGKRALSASGDQTLCLWDLESGAVLRRFEGHNSEGDGPSVAAVVVLPDGSRGLSGYRDGTLRLWDLASGAELRRFEGHSDIVVAVAVLPDGKRALSASYDGTLRLWDLASGAELRRFEGGTVAAVAVLPDGKRGLSGSNDGTLRLWDLESGVELCRYSGEVSAIVVLPDGKRALSGSADHTLRLWDLEVGPKFGRFEGHRHMVKAVAVLPDGQRALSGSWDQTLGLWDLRSGKELRRFEGHNLVMAVAALPDGQRALFGSGDGTLRLLDLGSGTELRRFEGHSIESDLPMIVAVAVAVLPDGKRALSASGDQTLCLWDLESGAKLHRFEGHNSEGDGPSVTAVVVLPDGSRALSGYRDGTLRLWDLESGAELRRFEGHSSEWDGHPVVAMAVLPDSKHALSGSLDKTLRLWDLESGAELRRFEGHNGTVEAVAVLPDGKRALSGADDHTLRLWDLKSGAELTTFKGDAPFCCCAITPDGRFVVAGDGAGQVHVLEILL